MNAYIIKHKTDNLYIHFNPRTGEYYVDDKIVGAVGFYEQQGKEFLKVSNLEQYWELKLINKDAQRRDIRWSQEAEIEAYDATHNTNNQ